MLWVVFFIAGLFLFLPGWKKLRVLDKTIILLVFLVGVITGTRNCNTERTARRGALGYSTALQDTSTKLEYPISGEGRATSDIGIKAYLDPKKTFKRSSSRARYVFVEDRRVFVDDAEDSVGMTNEQWLKMPAGKYVVYPRRYSDIIYFRWWQ